MKIAAIRIQNGNRMRKRPYGLFRSRRVRLRRASGRAHGLGGGGHSSLTVRLTVT